MFCILVANVAPSAQVVKSLDRMGWNVPIVSHWGPAGGRFSELAGPSARQGSLHPDLQLFRQADAEGRNGSGRAEEEISGDQDRSRTSRRRSASPMPTMRMHLTALAIAKAGSTEGPKIREGFYGIDKYEGLIKTYNKPFTPTEHDALGPDDYHFHLLQGRRNPSADELTLVCRGWRDTVRARISLPSG